MTAARMRAVVLAALVCGAGVVALVLASDHQDAKAVWAIFGPVVGWSFVGTGLYAWRRRPESRTGALMVLLGFAWFLSTLDAANPPAVYTLALVLGGLWGGVFLHLGMSFPTAACRRRARPRAGRRGLRDLPVGFVPALLFAGPRELGCDDCPDERPAGPPRPGPRGGGDRLQRAPLRRPVRDRPGRALVAALAARRRRSSACSSRPSTCARCSRSCSSPSLARGAGRRGVVGRVRVDRR